MRIRYEAEDGTLFDYGEDCLEYEKKVGKKVKEPDIRNVSSIREINRRALTCGHGLVLGVPGSGGHLLVKEEILQVLKKTEEKVLILDEGGEYTYLARGNHGRILPVEEIRFNPFGSWSSLSLQQMFILELLAFACDNPDIMRDSFFKRIVSELLYEKKVSNLREFYDGFCDYQDKMEGHEDERILLTQVIDGVRIFLESGYFSDETEDLGFKRLVVFDFSNVQDDSFQHRFYHFLVLGYLSQQMGSSREFSRVYLEGNRFSLFYFTLFANKCQDWGCMMLLALDSYLFVSTNAFLKCYAEHCGVIFISEQSECDWAHLQEDFGLSNAEVTKIRE